MSGPSDRFWESHGTTSIDDNSWRDICAQRLPKLREQDLTPSGAHQQTVGFGDGTRCQNLMCEALQIRSGRALLPILWIAVVWCPGSANTLTLNAPERPSDSKTWPFAPTPAPGASTANVVNLWVGCAEPPVGPTALVAAKEPAVVAGSPLGNTNSDGTRFESGVPENEKGKAPQPRDAPGPYHTHAGSSAAAAEAPAHVDARHPCHLTPKAVRLCLLTETPKA
eukprot:CAMPEP_0115057846 /NCGR_PEP_ID=MMETSP0227-20121206/5995_1 /TAXON_ID=89957 /ORGANISM="Polarella glacialis, Strain CCMP 1383" /LENGTH=223 /DNA_ID=CAMNT_0002442715 /DNA_START=523 /DNA_END=1193 /DNA_ORIENTATION=-